MGLGADGAYTLAWIKLWVESCNFPDWRWPTCNALMDKPATYQFDLLACSTLCSDEEPASASKNDLNVSA